MQHDPLDSQLKNRTDNPESGSTNAFPEDGPIASKGVAWVATNGPSDCGMETEEDSDEASHAMRGRYLRAEDHSVFKNWIATNGPIELEIGSGKGLFLTNAARRAPDRRFVGLELAAKYALECQARIEKNGPVNAKFFACDAVAVIDQDVSDGSLDAVHVYFPDPWWKSRHKKRRVLNDQSLCNIERILKPNGALHFWTDVLDYYEGTLELIDQVTKLKGPFFVSEPPAEHDMDYLTHFERRTRRNGLPVYRSRFTKV